MSETIRIDETDGRIHHPSASASVAVAVGTALAVAAVALGSTPGSVLAQAANLEVQRHVEAARELAGDTHVRAFLQMCGVDEEGPESGAPDPVRGMPEWFSQPAQVFDNLYFVGTRGLNAWAVTTSEGIVIIDPLYDYNVDLAVIRGLEMLGLDPEDISHVIVNHGHGDHFGGARRLQQTFGATVVMGTEDWDLVVERPRDQPIPDRDMEIVEDRTLTIGDTEFTFMKTPGHTLGTTSLLFPVRDGGDEHLASMWGGTAFNFQGRDRFLSYIESSERFADLIRETGADVTISNHDVYDDAHRKIAELREREPGESHPWVVGNEAAAAYVEIAGHCAQAELARRGPAA